MDIYSLLKESIEIPSLTGEEGKIQLFWQRKAESLGLKARLVQVLPKRPNLIAWRGKGGPLILAHADVFPPLGHPDPFTLRVEGGRLIGRGVLDAKGQIAALFKAISLSKRPIQVGIVVDNEGEGKGSELLEVEAEGAVVLEPTNLQVAIAEAGSIELEIEVIGKPSHSTVSEEAVNPIIKSFEIYEKIKRLPFFKMRHQFFPRPWISVEKIEGGVHPGVTPENCRLTLSIAILPNVKVWEVAAEVERLIVSEGAFRKVLDISPPFEINPSEKIALTLKKARDEIIGGREKYIGMCSWTDAENLILKGIPSVVFGAGDLAQAHSNEESVSLEELEKMSEVLAHFIDTWQPTESKKRKLKD